MHGMMKLAETELHGCVVDDVCGMVIHFIEVRNADKKRRVPRPGARWLMEATNEWGCNSSRSMGSSPEVTR